MLQIKTYVFYFVVSLRFISSYGNQMPFHLRFFGANSKGIELIYQQYNIMFGNAVNLCFKVCKENWWCGALRKCADRPQLFQCDVVCQFNSLENRNYRHGDERCATFQVGDFHSFQMFENGIQ